MSYRFKMDKKIESDIDYLVNNIEKIHKNPFENISKNALKKELLKAASVEKEYISLVIQEGLALMRDAHTKVTGFCTDWLPIDYSLIDGELYVVKSPKANEDFLYKRVISINNIPINSVIKKVARLSSKENGEMEKVDIETFISSNHVLHYYKVSSSGSVSIQTPECEIVLTPQSENSKTLLKSEISRTLFGNNPILWGSDKRNDPTYFGNDTYQCVHRDKTLIFQYNECRNLGHSEEELAKFQDELIKKVNKDEVDNVVVDLRLNRGGSTYIMEDIFEKFPRSKNIYVAMSKYTFSSALHHLLYLKLQKDAVLIGENAGQKPNRYGDRKVIELPNTKIKVNCAYKYFELLPGQDLEVITPDIHIPITINAYRTNTDPLDGWISSINA